MFTEGNEAKTVTSRGLDIALEVTWLLLIFLLPVYFNPFGYQAFYYAKALLLQFVVCLLLGLYLARWFLTGHGKVQINLLSTMKQSPLQAAVIVFGLLWVISTVFSVMPVASFWGSMARKNGLISLIAWIVFFLIVIQCVLRRTQIYRALTVLIISAGMVSLFGIMEYIDPWLLTWLSRNGRVSSTDGNPLSLSGFIAMVLPANIALVMLVWYGPDRGRKKMLKVIGLLLALALQMICLYLAQYSITILLFVVGMFIFFLLVGICLRRKITIALSASVLIGLFILAAIIVGQTLMPQTVDTAVAPATQDTSVAGRTGLNTLGLRVKQWECAINVILDSPEVPFYQDNPHFLRRWIGYGPEMFVIVSQARYPPTMKSDDTYSSQLLGQPENHYLYSAVTIGLIGLTALLAVIIIFFYLGFKVLRKSRDRDVIFLTCAFIAAVAQYCVHILFNPTAILPEFVFWLMLALMASLDKMGMDVSIEGNMPANKELTVKRASANAGNGRLRKAIAVLIIILFAGIDFGLTFSPVLADMKLGSALWTWSTDSNKTMANLAGAVNLEPGESVYYGYIGAYAFKLAAASSDTADKSKLVTLSAAAYEAAGNREPYLAYWNYTTGDVYSYWASHVDPGKWKDALRCYKRADILLPDDAVILNKWALALMLNGDYAEAGRKLSVSRNADGEWIQTAYYTGLLDIYERCYCSAGYCFVYPVEQEISNIGHYASFCGKLALYGGLEKVEEGLMVYNGCHPGDWTGQALLGIAEVYDNRLVDAEGSFHRAAHNVPPEDAGMLKEIITHMGKDNPGFQPMAQDIADSLAGKIPGNSR